MFIIVFAAKELDYLARFGYDVMSGKKYNPNLTPEEQTGAGEIFPGSPTCEFRGQIVPAVVGMSEKGCITSDILVTALKKLDELDIYPRVPGGPIPFLLLDAHDSRLQIPFLEYVNDN